MECVKDLHRPCARYGITQGIIRLDYGITQGVIRVEVLILNMLLYFVPKINYILETD